MQEPDQQKRPDLARLGTLHGALVLPFRGRAAWNQPCIHCDVSHAHRRNRRPSRSPIPTSRTGQPMTHPREPEPLRPMLRTAESQLVERIEEVCSHEVKGESTAELMRLEETLTDAARAAKQAVSLRRRLRTGHGATEPSQSDSDVDDESVGEDRPRAERRAQADDRASSSDDESAVREFLDERGMTWRVWAVTPEQMQSDRLIADQMGDYRQGWLAFECPDSS